jgi:hypothetical protein
MNDVMILRRGGSSVKTGLPAIYVDYPPGSVCTCSNGTKTYTANDNSGLWLFTGLELGEWTVTATGGTNSESVNVEILETTQMETVKLLYGLYLYRDGLVDGYTFGISKDEGTATITYNETDMLIHVGSYISFGVWCKEKIDVTKYSTLNIAFENGDMSLESGRNMFGLSSATGYSDGNFTASVKFNNFSGSKTLSLDISSITGSYYVRLRGLTSQSSGSFDANITRLWLE